LECEALDGAHRLGPQLQVPVVALPQGDAGGLCPPARIDLQLDVADGSLRTAMDDEEGEPRALVRGADETGEVPLGRHARVPEVPRDGGVRRPAPDARVEGGGSERAPHEAGGLQGDGLTRLARTIVGGHSFDRTPTRSSPGA